MSDAPATPDGAKAAGNGPDPADGDRPGGARHLVCTKLQFWVPDSRSYHGELIGTATRADIGVQATNSAGSCWSLRPAPAPVPATGVPGAATADRPGPRCSRASHAWPVRSRSAPITPPAQGRIPAIATLPAGPDDLQQAAAAAGRGRNCGSSPPGNLVLRYDTTVKGRDLLNDLRHLLKLSNIG